MLNITFNCLRTGLGNNGGSRTLILCSETINKLKLDANCGIASTVDKFDWFPHKKPWPSIPPVTNWLIATGVHSVADTIKYSRKNVKKGWYIRGHETWVKGFDEKTIINLYRNPLHKFTNSRWIYELIFDKSMVKPHLIYQGIDLNYWNNLQLRKRQDKITIGCLHGKKKTKHWDHFQYLAKHLGTSHFRFIAYGDNYTNDDISFCDSFVIHPSIKQLNEIYSKCHFWFAPTTLEGLHNPPMEAALCGCYLIRGDNKRCGMIDYSDESNSFVYNQVDDAIDFLMSVSVDNNYHTKQSKLVSDVIHKIGTREVNMVKFINVLKSL